VIFDIQKIKIYTSGVDTSHTSFWFDPARGENPGRDIFEPLQILPLKQNKQPLHQFSFFLGAIPP
jgi:hypothetical protein